ncbi:iron complex transport system substrate-binding protein [Salinibacillus kushneri]|uniref:Iron complex transport system substrate-binding protein n=1 Tax=Salinibacillus kushneri TaxID=237682 RepID=A0A1I0ATE0_9BACI|nr:cobalamin-binding protein [Salinibacillus kushneri]SES97646.1 iron complex transport system substrate-binding protein [Salinibacillus kushneri]
MRLVSICPSNTEMIEYLGLTEFLVGVDDYSDWPEFVKTLPSLGPDLDIDMDKVESLDPDLVLASLSVPGMEKNVEELERRNIPHIVLNPNSLEEIGENLLFVGQHLGVSQKAKEVYQSYKNIISEYRARSDRMKEKKSIYWEWWPKPIFTPGKTNWLTEISELAGTYNIFATENQASVQTTWNDVKERNPDIICMVWVGVKTEKMNPDLVRRRPQWEQMKVIKDNQIFVLDESLFCRPSPRLLEGLEKLGSLLFPDIFPKYQGNDPLLR